MRINLPKSFDTSTIASFYKEVMDHMKLLNPQHIIFDFTKLNFVRPSGIVALSNMINLIELFYPRTLIGYNTPDDYADRPRSYPAVDFLDDSLFFIKVMGYKLHPGSHERSTTNGLVDLKQGTFNKGYIDNTIEFLKGIVGLRDKSFSFLDTALTEVFNNIIDHSESPIGGSVFAQHYPKEKQIILSIADCGVGIPTKMSRKFHVDDKGQPLDTDAKLINFATYPRVSTKSNPRNRGVGLEVLNSIIRNNQGRLIILSNEGQFSYNSSTGILLSNASSHYSGTVLNLYFNTLEKEEEEDLSWDSL
ncbi:ATPase-like ATP-binding protein [Paenibacillus marchantiophytorum]|uniref:ATPase-like ATP-binding protein n=1 Tax=Paenibacillus marchantiophytorum TaxID=1619310 RepID=A0ABQ2BMI2_9BACL|nr:ATP-binding protein [Paenibacillus marchantiophytorum]GGI43224.1 ATPase-like ATP-binding protein [Paenibacillus marchantiophytorum]